MKTFTIALTSLLVAASPAIAQAQEIGASDADSAASEAPAEAPDEPERSWLRITAEAELGFLAALSHKIQFSNYGTPIDYRRDGGQDVLFPFTRPAWRPPASPQKVY